MSPAEVLRNGRRRLLAEEHVTYALVIVVVVISATVYAIDTHDHSANVWAVYVGAITGIFGFLQGRHSTRNSRESDK